MKNFRKAALALATASTVAFAGTAVASAQDAPFNSDELQSSAEGAFRSTDDVEGILGSNEDQTDDQSTGSSNLLWKIGNALEADQTFKGTDIFGSGEDNTPFGEQSLFAQLWQVGTYTLIAGAIAGVVIGIFNELKFQGILPHTFPF